MLSSLASHVHVQGYPALQPSRAGPYFLIFDSLWATFKILFVGNNLFWNFLFLGATFPRFDYLGSTYEWHLRYVASWFRVRVIRCPSMEKTGWFYQVPLLSVSGVVGAYRAFYRKRDRLRRTEIAMRKSTIRWKPLVNPRKIIIPPFHIKLAPWSNLPKLSIKSLRLFSIHRVSSRRCLRS